MGKARLLVVEDDIDIGNMLKIYFSGMDFDVDVAMRGKDALEKTKQVLPHLIVLDIMLPDIDGYEVCRNLRTNMRTSHIPVIFVTALTDVEWPARLEWLRFPQGGDVLLDAAHNPAGAEALADYVRATTGALPLVFGVMRDKDVDAIVRDLRFPEPAPCGRTPLTAQGLSKSYGSLEIFTDVDLAIDRGSRVVILGLNGAGKTTLLRILGGLDAPDTGEIRPGHGLKMGYYAQEHETLDLDRSVLENMQSSAPNLTDTQARSVLGAFLFSGDDAHKPSKVLSGGEKTRLALATLIVSQANVLLLDEPTNNLDPASREEVLGAIRSYEGAIVLVTHDEGAVEALQPDRVLILPDGVEDLWTADYQELISLA